MSSTTGWSNWPASQSDPYFMCLATELRTDRLSWKEIVADDDACGTKALRLDVYVWPMITEYRQGTQKVLARVPLPVSAQ